MEWKYPTDKKESGLIKVYDDLFGSFESRNWKSLLEIGVELFGFLLWIRDYHPKFEKVVGIDLLSRIPTPDGITFYNGNQRDSEFLERVGKESGPFDVIIDDGYHWVQETMTCFNTLFPYLNSNGVYVIEDWGVGYNIPETGMVGLVTEIISKCMGNTRMEGSNKTRSYLMVFKD